MTSTTGNYTGYERSGTGWVTYAALMLGLAGTFNVFDGIVALSRSKFYTVNATYVFSDLHTWGWIVLIGGVLQLLVAAYVATGSEFARWTGVAIASLNGIAQLLFLPGYPLWSIAAFTMDILIVYALVVYAGKRLKQI